MSTNPGQYCVRLDDGEELIVDLDFLGGQFVAKVGDQRHRLALRNGSSGQLIVDIDERSYRVSGDNGATSLVSGGHEAPMGAVATWSAGLRRLHDVAGSPESAGAAKEREVTSPLTGLVVAACVEPGERVARGQTLLVVEAMKMENRITAPCDGHVTSFHVEIGQTVRMRDPLVSLTPE